MVDKLKIAEVLGAHPYGAFWVKDIHLFSWGNEVVFECLYEPGAPAEPIPFQVVLQDCRDIQWRVFHLGTSDHRKPLHMLTDSFGITVSYQALTIEKPHSPAPSPQARGGE
jgi:hypothetical protein